MVDDNAALVARFYAAVAAGDGNAAVALIPDVRWYEAAGSPFGSGDGSPHIGGGQVAERVLGPLLAAVPDLAVTVERQIMLGATVAVIGAYTGTAVRDGALERIGFVHVWQVHDGVITEFRQFTDVDRFRALSGR